MTDFDLGDPAPDADEEPADESDGEETVADPEPSPTADETPDPTLDTDSSDDAEPGRDPTETGPAFPYSEVKQSPLYAREETWTTFNDELDMTLTPKLREEGIRDDELREIHDIVLEVALEHLDEFPERLKEKRRELQ